MNFLKQVQLAENGEVQARIRQAAITTAVAVLKSRPANTPQAIDAHRKRAEFAKKVLADPTGYQRALAMAVVTDDNAPETAPQDSQIQAIVDGLWDLWSGVVLDPVIVS